MAYVPFTNDYTGARTPAYVAAEAARQNAYRSRIGNAIDDGNAVMGGLVTECCSDPQYAGQGFFDAPGLPSGPSVAAAGTVANSPNNPDVQALYQAASQPLTPVDILTGTFGFPMRRGNRAWPRPRLPRGFQKAWALGYPNDAATDALRTLVPACPCGGPPQAPIRAAVPTPGPPASVSHETVASETARLAAWRVGLSGLGQVDSTNPLSGFGGLLAIVAGAGMLWWATRK